MAFSSLTIPTPRGEDAISPSAGRPIFILGQNGSGKSALVHNIKQKMGATVVYLPGSRSSYFENESLSLTSASRNQLVANSASWDISPDTRWKLINGPARNERAILDLQHAEVQYKITAADEIAKDGASSAAIVKLQGQNSPLDRLNHILAQANLPVRIFMKSGELRAQRAGADYSIAKMSDGERTALILAAEVIVSKEDAIFLIDEPELHLHRSIVAPLLAAFFAEKPNAAFIISTHELELPSLCPASSLVLVRSSEWRNGVVQRWDVDILPDAGDIPDWLRTAVLGSRRKILFIEGNSSSSLDLPIYALLFPAISVRPLETCREVKRAVAGLRALAGSQHQAEAFGLVDADGADVEFLERLASEHIYPLPTYSVEGLYYSAPVLAAVASQQEATLNVSAAELLVNSRQLALDALRAGDACKHLASRLAERKLKDELFHISVNRNALTSGDTEIEYKFTSPYPSEYERISKLVERGELGEIIRRYPVRESAVLDKIAVGLRFRSRQDYERAALARIDGSDELRSALRALFGNAVVVLQ